MRHSVAEGLADALLAGPWEEGERLRRARWALDGSPRWLGSLTGAVSAAYPRPPVDRRRELVAFIELQLARRRVSSRSGGQPAIRRWLAGEVGMGRRPWPVPALANVAALAEFLGLSDGELAWLADARGLERRVSDGRLRHYAYGWLPRAGGVVRVIERPKHRLKAVQRRILHDILDWIPVHEAAHGFIRGRSAISHAQLHTGRRVVIRVDLRDHFASVRAGRVFGVYRSAGYSEAVAHCLTALCTNVISLDAWASVPHPGNPSSLQAHHRLGRRLATPHLPQGAPSSPALANLVAFRLDRRLSGLAAAVGARYTRYADDLTFSGGASVLRAASGLCARTTQIAAEEGFVVNPGKSSLSTRAARQRVCGIVVNQRVNVSRAELDRLRATLHNAARRGPDGENRDGHPDFCAHLRGRIAWVESLNPHQGAKLRRRFEQIDWTQGATGG